MKKEEIGKEYMIKVGEFNHVPIMLKKDDIRYILTDIIDGDGSTYWCDFCRIKKEAEFPIPQETEYEPEAETLANGGTLTFTLLDAFIDYQNINDIRGYELTLEKLIHGIKDFLRIFLILAPVVKRNILKYDKVNEMYYLNMGKVDGIMDDCILQMSLFNRLLFDPKKRKLLRKLGIKKKEW